MRFVAVLTAALGALVVASCGGSSAPPSKLAPIVEVRPDAGAPDGGPSVDVEEARRVVAAFALAVMHQNRDELQRVFSFRALAQAFQPRRVVEVSPTLYARFVEEASARLLDPKGTVYRMLAGLEVGKASVSGGSAVIHANSSAGALTFHVARRGEGPLQVVRVE